jgi:hypothetical protein
MTKKRIVSSKMLANRFDCFGCYDADDTMCRHWCQMNIRCAIAQGQYFEFEILEDLFAVELDSDRVQ